MNFAGSIDPVIHTLPCYTDASHGGCLAYAYLYLGIYFNKQHTPYDVSTIAPCTAVNTPDSCREKLINIVENGDDGRRRNTTWASIRRPEVWAKAMFSRRI